MRLFGIGIDIVQNKRILGLLTRSNGERFLKKALHPEELLKLESFQLEKNRIEFVSSRWAAKEAVVKASRRKDLDFAAIWIKSNPDGRRRLDPGSPELFYERSVQEVLDQLHIKQSFISISHEDEYSVASVMLYM